MLMLIVVWTLVMAAVVFMANHLWSPSDPRTESWAAQTEPQADPRDQELLQEHFEACQQVLGNLVSNSTPEGISPYVFNRLDVFSDIVRYYRLNPGTQISDTRIDMDGMSVIHLPDGPAIEGHWKAEDGRMIDVVFRRQDDQWLVDWHHFARYSDHPWALFLAGDGPDEAEFRLLARQRLTRQVIDEDLSKLSLALHAPRFARPDDPGPASPVFELEWDSEQARMLMAGFDQAHNGRRPFGSKLPQPEPDDDMMRIRLVVRRIDEENARRFEIVEVRACHWLQLDHPGVDLDETTFTESQ